MFFILEIRKVNFHCMEDSALEIVELWISAVVAREQSVDGHMSSVILK